MLDGVLSLVSSARVGFIGLYRDEETLQPVEYYVKLPELGDGERDAIVLDPMLATGRSSAAAVKAVKGQARARSRWSAWSRRPKGSSTCRANTRTCGSSPHPSTAD
jgi:uracil phosphoribosyltransferase